MKKWMKEQNSAPRASASLSWRVATMNVQHAMNTALHARQFAQDNRLDFLVLTEANIPYRDRKAFMLMMSPWNVLFTKAQDDLDVGQVIVISRSDIVINRIDFDTCAGCDNRLRTAQTILATNDR